jgi:hypothetical protein
MKFILTFACVLLATVSIGIAASLNPEGTDGDKIPIVISGYLTKIDVKKKELTVNGTEVTPAGQPQKFTAEIGAGVQSGGGRGGGGRGGGGRGGGGGGRGGRGSEEAARDFSVNVTSDTVIETEKGTLTLNDLRVQDYVVVLGNPKGKSINATSITVSIR